MNIDEYIKSKYGDVEYEKKAIEIIKQNHTISMDEDDNIDEKVEIELCRMMIRIDSNYILLTVKYPNTNKEEVCNDSE